MNRIQSSVWSALGGAAAGALYGVGEAAAVWAEGRLWLPSPLPLALGAAVSGALVGLVPGAALGAITRRGAQDGLVGGAVAVGLLELALLVFTDAPPFGEAPWWVGSPVALAGGAALILGVGTLIRRGPSPLRAALALGLALSSPALRWQVTPPPPAPKPAEPRGLGDNQHTTPTQHHGL